MTDAQREALAELEKIQCQMSDTGKTCNGPWCSARKKILENFTEAEMFEVKVTKPEYDPTDPYDEGK